MSPEFASNVVIVLILKAAVGLVFDTTIEQSIDGFRRCYSYR